LPLRRIGGLRGVEAAQRNAATLRARGIEPNPAIRFQAGEISHDQILQIVAARKTAKATAARPVSSPAPISRPEPIVLFESVIEGIVIKLTAQRG